MAPSASSSPSWSSWWWPSLSSQRNIVAAIWPCTKRSGAYASFYVTSRVRNPTVPTRVGKFARVIDVLARVCGACVETRQCCALPLNGARVRAWASVYTRIKVYLAS